MPAWAIPLALMAGGSAANAVGYHQGTGAMAEVMEDEAERQEGYLGERRQASADELAATGGGNLAMRIGRQAAGGKADARKVGKAFGSASGKTGADARRIGRRAEKQAGRTATLAALPAAQQEQQLERAHGQVRRRRVDALAQLSQAAAQAEMQEASHTGQELRFLGQMANLIGQGTGAAIAYGKK